LFRLFFVIRAHLRQNLTKIGTQSVKLLNGLRERGEDIAGSKGARRKSIGQDLVDNKNLIERRWRYG
jgi:hypothetical protein